MKRPGLEVIRSEVVQCEAEILEQTIARIKRAPIRIVDAHILRKDIGELAKLLFGLLTSFGVDHLAYYGTRCHKRTSFSKSSPSLTPRPLLSAHPNAGSGERHSSESWF